jgi:hypothetical protein
MEATQPAIELYQPLEPQHVPATSSPAKESFSGNHQWQGSILDFNQALDRLMIPLDLTEFRLRQLYDALLLAPSARPRAAWLSLARLTEASLLHAGTLADSCEFRAAGDLLFNPIKVEIHRRGAPMMIKQRHGRISDQLRRRGESLSDFKARIQRDVVVRVSDKPLLASLMDEMERGPVFSSDYLDDLHAHLQQISTTIGFLSAWSLDSPAELCRRRQAASPKERQFIDSQLCRFTPQRFHHLGHEVRAALSDPTHQSPYLARPAKPGKQQMTKPKYQLNSKQR